MSRDMKWANHIEEVYEIPFRISIIRLLCYFIALWSDHTLTMLVVYEIHPYFQKDNDLIEEKLK